MKLLLKLLLIALVMVSQTYQKCGFTEELQRSTKVSKVDLYGGEGRFLQTTTWTPIRIYLDFTTLDAQKGALTDAMITNIKNLMNTVAAALTGLIKVKASSANLKIDFCADDKVKVSAAVKAGVATDIVIFPYVDMTFPETTEAAATYCAQDTTTNRPIAGYVSFNKFMDFNKKNAMYYYSLLVFHEINHILSFNASLFDGNFLDSAGVVMPKSKVVIEKTVNGLKRSMIATPKVIAATKKHFNCATAEGLELENQGGSGTAGSHWEARVMSGDFMIGESYAENVISDMSLALMEDSGWYQTNYYTGGLFRFGKNAGCDFLNTKCVSAGVTKFPNEFATRVGAPMCFTGRTAKGVSSLQTSQTVDAAYQYFSDTSMAGTRNADFCPVAAEITSNDMFFVSSCWSGSSTTYPASMGEKIGASSNCFISTLVPQNDNTAANWKGNTFTICHEVTCNAADRTYTVKVGTASVKCSTAGGAVTVSGFDGTLNCADYNLICTRSVDCGDTLDCITKKSTALTADYTNYGTPTTGTTTPAAGTTTTTPTASTTTPTTTPTTPTTTTPTASTTTPTTSTTTPTVDPSSTSGFYNKIGCVFMALFFILI